ncbi:hypothetical protein D3C87_278790 [compost metagenome]
MDTIVFHYNKAHNSDKSIPPWVIKTQGKSHYVTHVTVEPGCGFCTKETPDNPHTKASIKVKGFLSISDGEAIITNQAPNLV